MKRQANTPTNLFTISELQDQKIVEFYVVQKRRATDFEASKLWKGSSGTDPHPQINMLFDSSTGLLSEILKKKRKTVNRSNLQ